MPSWPEKRVYIGSSTKRIDGPAKVTGAAKYASDVQPEGWLYGMIFRSKWPKAKITSINLDKAKKVPGIKAAIVDRPGERTVRYYGEELAAVAGTSKQACLDALRLIEVEAAPLPFVVKEEDAKLDTSPRVWDEKANFMKPKITERGKVDDAFGECATIVEGFYTTPVQLHHPLETHGNTVLVNDEGVTAWASTQGITSVRDNLADNLSLAHNKVRVISEFMGGGFGSKFGAGVEGGLAARLSKEANAPVKLMLTRFDEALAVGNRPSSFQKVRLAANAEGKLVAYELENYGSPGFAAGGSSSAGSGNAAIPAPYIYSVPNIRVKQTSVAINAGSA